jgi:hypothetical protein
MILRQVSLLVLVAALLFSPQGSHAQKSPVFSDYEYYVTEDGAFGLYKPKDWKAGTQRYPSGRMVFAHDPKELSYAGSEIAGIKEQPGPDAYLCKISTERA